MHVLRLKKLSVIDASQEGVFAVLVTMAHHGHDISLFLDFGIECVHQLGAVDCYYRHAALRWAQQGELNVSNLAPGMYNSGKTN